MYIQLLFTVYYTHKLSICTKMGGAEFAGQENDGQRNYRGWKLQDWKKEDKSAGLENAGLENDGQIWRGGKCRTGKWRTKVQGWKMQDWKMTDKFAGVENAGLEIDGQKCIYTVSGKKGTNSIWGITSSNTDRFSKFFHFYNLLEICNKAVVKYPIAPKTRHYTTLWNIDVRK